MPDLYDLDTGIVHCPCGTLTANDWLLCSRCTAMETDDKDWHRREGNTDPNAVADG